jgi:putative membrane protein
VQPGAAISPQPATRAGVPNATRTFGAQTSAAVDDRLFAAAATEGGLTELMLSQLGQERATDPELKKFSERMLEEHTRIATELNSLAAQKGIAVPRATSYCAQFCGQSLAGLSGLEFDHWYAKAQLAGHMGAVAAFEAEAKRGSDPDLTAFAKRTLPRIKEHFETIKPIAKKYMMEHENEREHKGGIGRIDER